MTDAGSPPLVFSTDALPPGDRFEAWRETFARVDVTTPDRAAFRASARVHPLGALRLIDFDLGPMSLIRTPELLRDGDDDFSLVICCCGSFRTIGPGGEGVVIQEGGALLVPHSVPGGTMSVGASQDISLVIPRKALGQALRDPDRAAATPPAGGGASLGPACALCPPSQEGSGGHACEPMAACRGTYSRSSGAGPRSFRRMGAQQRQ